MQKRFKLRSKKGSAEIAQFPLTIYCLFLILLVPLMNMVTLLVAGATAYLATNDLAAKAATQPNFAQALNAMSLEAYSFQTNSLAQFVKMSPQGGYLGCGYDLFVLATNIGGTGIQSSAADQPLSTNIDTTKNIYEMQVVSSHTVAPLVSLASLPLLGAIPGLGTPVKLTFAASRPVEHPGGMQLAPPSSPGLVVQHFARACAPPPAPASTPSTAANTSIWRNPNIYNLIAASGQTIVSQTVVTIYGNLEMQNSGANIQPGQNVWMDSQAVGSWGSGSASMPGQFDASGSLRGSPLPTGISPLDSASMMALICYVGNPPAPTQMGQPPVRYDYANGTFDSDPKCFYVGNTLLNYQIPGGGNLNFMCNYNGISTNGSGKQIVRIIITQ